MFFLNDLSERVKCAHDFRCVMKTQRREGSEGWPSNLLATQQMGGCAGVEQCSEDVVNAALKLALQRRPPLCGVALGALGARVGDALWQL